MDIPQHVIDVWQDVWKQICYMAYYRTNISSEVFVESRNYTELLKYMLNSKSFDELTLDYTWKKVSSQVESRDVFVVPELTKIFVPRILFETIGVFSWFKYSFPNCSINFWEDQN